MDPFANGLKTILKRAPGALREDLCGFERTVSLVMEAMTSMMTEVVPDGFDRYPDLLRETRNAVATRRRQWDDEVAAIAERVAPGVGLCASTSEEDALSHLRCGMTTAMSLADGHGETLRLESGGRRLGTVDPYGIDLDEGGIAIPYLDEEGEHVQGTVRVALRNIHAVTSTGRMAFLVASPLTKTDGIHHVEAYVVSLIAETTDASTPDGDA